MLGLALEALHTEHCRAGQRVNIPKGKWQIFFVPHPKFQHLHVLTATVVLGFNNYSSHECQECQMFPHAEDEVGSNYKTPQKLLLLLSHWPVPKYSTVLGSQKEVPLVWNIQILNSTHFWPPLFLLRLVFFYFLQILVNIRLCSDCMQILFVSDL